MSNALSEIAVVPDQRPWPAAVRWWLAAVALLVFLTGVLVYATDRGPHTAWLLPEFLRAPPGRGPLFGALGRWLPSFAHAFAFSIWTALLPGSRRAVVACLVWAVVDGAFEFAQLPVLARPIARALTAGGTDSHLLDHLAVAFAAGTFDTDDLVSIAAGCAAAFVLLIRSSPQPLHDGA